MKKYSCREILFAAAALLGFVLGILFVNLWGDTYFREGSIWGNEQLSILANVQPEANAYFFCLLANRGKWFLLFWLIGHTVAGVPAVFLALLWFGFSGGMLLTLGIVKLRLTGILCFLAMLLPQIVMYAPLFLTTAAGIYEAGMERYRNRLAFQSWQSEKAYLKLLVTGLPLLLLAVALESYANPWLLRQALRYLL